MTILRTLLARGYLPKELPPAFHSEDFARYAVSRPGRAHLAQYRQQFTATDCIDYVLALPSSDLRLLRIPHPSAYAYLSSEVAKSLRRLLRKAGVSRFSRSRPVYTERGTRAIRTLVDPANIAREKALSRSSASYLLRADISQFYPSLYTHAVGWAIDPKLRSRAHWQNRQLLGKRIDQVLMDLQGKISQGIPIGTDVSFLLAEIVLGQVDHELRAHAPRAFRWFDDYEIACDSKQEAEAALTALRASLRRFNLRLNPKKTAIVDLPLPSSDGWQPLVVDASRNIQSGPRDMVRFFDTVFDLRLRYPETPILLYGLGLLFRVPVPAGQLLRVAESCITQAILCEPGCAQKAFALLTFWKLNGATVSVSTIATAIERLIMRHEAAGTSSDLSWALAYCIDQRIPLSRRSAKALSRFHDDFATIQSLHARAEGLLPQGFSGKALAAELATATLDGRHWLALYECVRHGFLPALAPIVQSQPMFADMLAKQISFYRQRIPAYASIVHPGGAPNWVVRAWIAAAAGNEPAQGAVSPPIGAAADLIKKDAAAMATTNDSIAEVVLKLLAQSQPPPTQPDPEASEYT